MSFEQQLSGEDGEKVTEVRCIIEDREKWKLLADVVAAMTPAYKLLRMVDSFAPAVGKVFYKAQRLQEWCEESAWNAVAGSESGAWWLATRTSRPLDRRLGLHACGLALNGLSSGSKVP